MMININIKMQPAYN